MVNIVELLRLEIQGYTDKDIERAETYMREAADEIERLRTLGDALASTGGQHGFDNALDAWKDYRSVAH